MRSIYWLRSDIRMNDNQSLLDFCIDYDPDLNWGNWLYLSGKGSDPRSRIFNCDRQAALYDPEGLYQKKWNK